MNVSNRFLALSALVVSLGICNIAKSANTFTDFIVPDGRIHGLQDTDADIGVTFDDMAGEWVVASGALAAGDFLVAGIGLDSLERTLLADVSLTGVGGFSMLKIRTIDDAGTNSQGFGLSDFVFDAPSIAEWSGIVDDLFGGNAALKKTTEGGMVILYEGADGDFDRVSPPSTLAGSAATITDGAVEVGEIGFTGPTVGGNVTDNATGEGWEATGPTVPSAGVLLDLNTGIIGTSFAANLSRLEGFGGLSFLGVKSFFDGGTIFDPRFTEFVGGGTLEGYGDGGVGVGPWGIGSDANFAFRPVPEPGSILCWTGIAMVIGAASRRNRKRAAK